MKTSTVIAIVLGVLLSFASAATGAGYLWSQDSHVPVAETQALPSVWPSKGGNALRAVAIPSGEMVAALPESSGADVLCQSISAERWESLLGGAVLRETRDGGCHVVTATLDVSAHLDGSPATLQNPSPVQLEGHPGEVEYVSPKVNSRLNLRLADTQPNPRIRPYLRIAVSGTARQPLDELATSIATALVQATMTSGPGLPPITKDQVIPARRVSFTPRHGIVDAPWPMISWQLCTALTDQLGGTGKPTFDGKCTVRGVRAAYNDAVSPRAYPDTIGGRPALITDDLVAIKLTDDSPAELTVTGGRSLRQLAETMLPQLLGQ